MLTVDKTLDVDELTTRGLALAQAVVGLLEREKHAEVVANQWDLQGIERGTFFRLARSFRPVIPAGTVAEIPLGLLDDGDVVPVEGGAGDYVAVDGLLIAGTIDAMWSEPEQLYRDADGSLLCPAGSTLWVVDWKTGTENNVPPPAKNWQLRAAAVLAGVAGEQEFGAGLACFAAGL